MKRGIVLALLVMAVAGMMVPAFANAPVIKALPIIIMGDEDAGDNNGTLYLMRYNDILDFGDPSVILWRNDSYTSDAFHVYMLPLAGGESTPTASTDLALVAPMTNMAYVDLVTSALLPSASMDMTYWNSSADNFFYFSLIDQAINQLAATPMTKSYGVTAATNGVDRAATYGSSFVARNDVMIVAAVSSGSTKAVVDTKMGADTTIWTVAGTTDSTTPTGMRKIFTAPVPATFWYDSTYDSLRPGTVQAQATTKSGTGVGYTINGADATKLMFGQWAMLDASFAAFLVPHDGGGGLTSPVLEFNAYLESDAASPELVPGWRMMIINGGYTHFEAAHTISPAGHLAAPYAGNPYTQRIYASAPYQLTEMGDGEWMSDITWFGGGDPNNGKDGRNYSFQFDLHHDAGATADRATFLIMGMDVYAFEQPAAGAELERYSGNGAFSAWIIENWPVIGSGVGQFYQGYFAMGPNGTYMDLGAGTARPGVNRMKKATSPWDARIDYNGSTLVRKNITMASEDPNRTPILSYMVSVFSAAGEQRGNYYLSYFGALAGDFGKPQTKVAGYLAGGVAPALATPVAVHSYAYLPAKVDAGDQLLAQIQVYSLGFYDGTAWGDDNGFIRISEVWLDEVELPDHAD